MNRLVMRDLNKSISGKMFGSYSKEDITKALLSPSLDNNQKIIRDSVVYMYAASTHFRRLIQYFASLTDLSYVVSPFKIDPAESNAKMVRLNYRKVLNIMSAFNIKLQARKIISVCLREDVFYGTMRVTTDNIIIQQLPSEYCRISVIEDGVANVTFDFSYFDTYKDQLQFYPEEFGMRYDSYKKKVEGFLRWQELDAPYSFAIKCSDDILEYVIPPFAGLLREILDLENYKQLKLTKEELENYAMIVMKLGIKEDGEYQMNLKRAKEFWQNLDSVLPEEIGSVLSPMDVYKIDFDRSSAGDADTVAQAEQNLFTEAGVSSLLFNNEKASANALLVSIKVDQALTYGIVLSIEKMINRYIQYHKFGKNFKVTFLDVSPFNRNEVGNAYIKACQYGLPFISYYAASQGLSQDQLDCMNYLEDDVLKLVDKFRPLRTSNTMSSSDSEGGAPTKDIEDLTDSGEQSREDSSDWG